MSDKTRIVKRAFNAGITGKGFKYRNDVEKHAYACQDLKNFYVDILGGIKRREGTRLLSFYDNIDEVRLVPFEFNREFSRLLVFKPTALKINHCTTERFQLPWSWTVCFEIPAITDFGEEESILVFKMDALDFTTYADGRNILSTPSGEYSLDTPQGKYVITFERDALENPDIEPTGEHFGTLKIYKDNVENIVHSEKLPVGFWDNYVNIKYFVESYGDYCDLRILNYAIDTAYSYNNVQDYFDGKEFTLSKTFPINVQKLCVEENTVSKDGTSTEFYIKNNNPQSWQNGKFSIKAGKNFCDGGVSFSQTDGAENPDDTTDGGMNVYFAYQTVRHNFVERLFSIEQYNVPRGVNANLFIKTQTLAQSSFNSSEEAIFELKPSVKLTRANLAQWEDSNQFFNTGARSYEESGNDSFKNQWTDTGYNAFFNSYIGEYEDDFFRDIPPTDVSLTEPFYFGRYEPKVITGFSIDFTLCKGVRSVATVDGEYVAKNEQVDVQIDGDVYFETSVIDYAIGLAMNWSKPTRSQMDVYDVEGNLLAYNISTPIHVDAMQSMQYKQAGGDIYFAHTLFTPQKCSVGNDTYNFEDAVLFHPSETEEDKSLEITYASEDDLLFKNRQIYITATKGNFDESMIGSQLQIAYKDKFELEYEWSNSADLTGKVTAVFPAQGEVRVRPEGGVWDGILILEESTDNGETWHEVGRTTSIEGSSNTEFIREFYDVQSIARCRMIKQKGVYDDSVKKYSPNELGVKFNVLRNATTSVWVEVISIFDETTAQVRVLNPCRGAFTSKKIYRSSWSETYGFPRTVDIHEERMMYAGNKNRPSTVWLSQTNNWNNFRSVSNLATDPLAYTLATDDGEPIAWLCSKQDIMIGSGNSEWSLGSRSADQALSADIVSAVKQSADGAEYVMPAQCENMVVFVRRGGTELASIVYDFATDSYDSTSLSTMCPELLESGCKQVFNQLSPHNQIWAITNNDKCFVFTYDKPNNVFAWSEMTFGEKVVNGCAISTGKFKSIFLAVKRGKYLCLERLDPNEQATDNWLDCTPYGNGKHNLSVQLLKLEAQISEQSKIANELTAQKIDFEETQVTIAKKNIDLNEVLTEMSDLRSRFIYLETTDELLPISLATMFHATTSGQAQYKTFASNLDIQRYSYLKNRKVELQNTIAELSEISLPSTFNTSLERAQISLQDLLRQKNRTLEQIAEFQENGTFVPSDLNTSIKFQSLVRTTPIFLEGEVRVLAVKMYLLNSLGGRYRIVGVDQNGDDCTDDWRDILPRENELFQQPKPRDYRFCGSCDTGYLQEGSIEISTNEDAPFELTAIGLNAR